VLHLRGCHPLCRTFPGSSTSTMISYSLPDQQLRPNGPTTPRRQRLPAITPTRFGLFRFRSPLLTESLLFSLPVGTEMFHFPTFPPNALCVQAPVTGHDPCRVSPFGHPRITARLPTPRGFSQAPTSFIGFWCQGIHRVPLVTCLGLHTKIRCSRPLCSSQGTGGIHSRTRRVPPAGGRSTRDGPLRFVSALIEGKARSLRTQQRAWAPVRSPPQVPLSPR
jgi:hypothetical protein